MKENKFDRIEFYKSMIYSLIYVSVGTIALFSLRPSSPLHGDWTVWVIFLTIPTSVLSFAVMLAFQEDPTILVLIIQLCMFLIAWRIVYSPTEIHVLRIKKK